MEDTMSLRFIPSVLLLVVVSCFAQAQLTQTLPAGFDSGAGGSGSAFPFNNTSAHIWQWHYDSAQFVATGPIVITEVYIRSLNNAPVSAFDFPSVEVLMASSSTDYTVAGNGVQAGHDPTFANNLNPDATVVRPAASWVAATPPTGWIPMGMTVPFIYDPTAGNDFIVQVTKCATITAWGTSIFGSSTTAGLNGGNRYGHRTICNSPTQDFSNNEYVPIVRIDYTPGATLVNYQVNQLGAASDLNGVLGSTSTPATVNLSVGQAAGLTVTSTAVGMPWELAIGTLPLVPAFGGAMVLADGQILNVNLGDPSLFFLWNGFASPPFSSVVIPVTFNAAANYSTQMGVLDPLSPTGISLSQPTRVVIQ
jgi:hypothetical protein